MKNKKGFTLIEILIVVVILGVLAALILPRFLAQPERAMLAEANQVLGAMIRGQQAAVDAGAGFHVVANNTTQADWNAIGMQPLAVGVATGAGPKFNYTCTVLTQTCQATRANATAGTCSVTIGGAWAAGNGYSTLLNGGCTM